MDDPGSLAGGLGFRVRVGDVFRSLAELFDLFFIALLETDEVVARALIGLVSSSSFACKAAPSQFCVACRIGRNSNVRTLMARLVR